MSSGGGYEAARLGALARYTVLDTPRHHGLDDVVELAVGLTGCPVAGVAFVDRNRVWLTSTRGTPLHECPRDEFPGGRGVGDPGDNLLDEAAQRRLAGKALLGGERPGRFFAEASCVTSDGYLLGSVFVADHEARSLTSAQRSGLAALARQAMTALELRRTQMSYRTVVDGAGHVVFHLDLDNRFVSVTPTWSQLTGYGVVRSTRQRLHRFVHPDDRAWVDERLRDMHDEKAPPALEFRLLRLVGAPVPVEMVARPLVDEGGRRLGLVGVLIEISERKAREMEAQHAQKLEALGRLSAGLAHEINTPIQFVGDNTRFLADSYHSMLQLLLVYRRVLNLEAGPLSWWERQELISQAEADADVEFLREEVPSAVRQSLEGVDRVATLVRAMKTFSHPGQAAQSPADINEAILATLTVARTQTKYVADVRVDLGELPLVVCTLGDLNQVFLNLIVNAADAIEDKGRLGHIEVSTRVEDDDVLVSVSDTGTGIPEDALPRIFDPFFTTKEVGRGTGHGLALARAIVEEKHAGTITVATEVGEGTTFTLRLPVRGRPAETGQQQ